MDMDTDRYLLVRAQISEIIDSLDMISYSNSPLSYILKLEHLRDVAAQYRLRHIADISMIFENALGRLTDYHSSAMICQAYIEILRDAVSCQKLSTAAARAMLGNVALRFHA